MPQRHNNLLKNGVSSAAGQIALGLILAASAPDWSWLFSPKNSWHSAQARPGRDDDSDKHQGGGGGDDNNSRGGGGGGGGGGRSDSGSSGGDGGRGGPPRGDDDKDNNKDQGRLSAIEYDANKNMLQFRVRLGGEGHDRDHQRDFAHLDHRGDQEEKSGHWLSLLSGKSEPRWKALEVGRRGMEDLWHPAKADEAINRALKGLEKQYLRSFSKGTTIIPKTRFVFDPSTFSGTEVLAVNLTPAAKSKAEALGFTVGSASRIPMRQASLTTLVAPPGMDAERAREILKKDLPDDQFELNRIYRLYRAATKDSPGQPQSSDIPITGISARCLGDRCFGREVIRWRDQLGTCARGLKVGVIDTAIDARHPAFATTRLHRNSFIPDGRVSASDWHGTGVLSLLAGSPLSGTPGLIPNADFYAASIFFSDENGDAATDTASLLRALDWMAASGVRVINMSFSGPRDEIVGDVIEEMSARGVVFVAAAGNEGPTADPSYPAAYPQVIAVTAVTRDLRNFRYANRGRHIDVSAPGVNIWTAVPGRREGYHSGTSFAAPFVTAVVSILPSDRLSLPKEELLDSLKVVDLGPPGRDPIYGRGLLQAPSSCSENSDAIADAGVGRIIPSSFQGASGQAELTGYSVQSARVK